MATATAAVSNSSSKKQQTLAYGVRAARGALQRSDGETTCSAFFGKPKAVAAPPAAATAAPPAVAAVTAKDDGDDDDDEDDDVRPRKRVRKAVVSSDTEEPEPEASPAKPAAGKGPIRWSPAKAVVSAPPTAEDDTAPSAAGDAADADANADAAGAPAAAAPGDAAWAKGDKVPYEALAKTFEAIEGTTKRLKIVEILSDFFRLVIDRTPEDLLPTVYLCVNRLAPEYEGIELGIGESLLMKAISNATGRTLQCIKTDYESVGDLGEIAQSSRSNQKTMFAPAKLSVRQVYRTLKEIALISGSQSMQKKVEKIQTLLVACRGNEPKYLIRSLEGKMRIGLAEQSVLVALAQACTISKKYMPSQAVTLEKNEKLGARVQEAVQTVKQVYSELPNYDKLVPALLLPNGLEELPSLCHLAPGIPVKPMLAHPTKSLSEVLDRFEHLEFTCEYKYDGERNQIHKMDDGRVLIYSRNLENLTLKYPDLVERLGKAPKDDVRSFILDCEAVAWDRVEKHILPFQVLSTRKRKDVNSEDVKVQVCLFAFDLLFLNGRPLIREPLRTRRQLLHEHFQEIEGQFHFARYADASTVDEIQTVLDDSIKGNCEGLMVKTLDKEATYEPSKRSRNWLKVKKDYLGSMGDSVDLVVIGAYYGRGKRTGVYGGYLLACYDEENEEYQSVCKIGTGFSEADLEQHFALLKEKVVLTARSYYKYGDSVAADVWFEPSQVWEVKAADLSISPVHRAALGLVDPSKGISLRFPRFIRVREDKTPENATTAVQIADMFRRQNINAPKSAGPGEDDDDY